VAAEEAIAQTSISSSVRRSTPASSSGGDVIEPKPLFDARSQKRTA
jgi:hypothetical protein